MWEEEVKENKFVMTSWVPDQEYESSNEENYLENVSSHGTYHDHGRNKFWEAREPSGWNLPSTVSEWTKLHKIQSEEEYLLDTGATCHVTNSPEFLEDIMQENIRIVVGENSSCTAQQSGTLNLGLKHDEGGDFYIILKKVFYVGTF